MHVPVWSDVFNAPVVLPLADVVSASSVSGVRQVDRGTLDRSASIFLCVKRVVATLSSSLVRVPFCTGAPLPTNCFGVMPEQCTAYATLLVFSDSFDACKCACFPAALAEVLGSVPSGVDDVGSTNWWVGGQVVAVGGGTCACIVGSDDAVILVLTSIMELSWFAGLWSAARCARPDVRDGCSSQSAQASLSNRRHVDVPVGTQLSSVFLVM
jgi:hypothetical protein